MTFTKAQQEFILNERRAYDARHKQMAAMHGPLLTGNASTLPKDVWGMWDRDAVQIQRDVLAVHSSIAAAASMPMPIGKLVHHFQTVSDSGDVGVSLDGRSNAKTDAPVIDYHGTPLPIIDSSFSFGWREMAAAQTEGYMLDAASSMNSVRKVAEKLEDMTLNGDSSIKVGDAQLYGLTNHPKRNTRVTGVTLNGATGAQWEDEVKGIIETMQAANFYGDATLYMNYADYTYAANTNYSTQYAGGKIRESLLNMEGVGEIVGASKIPANTIIAVIKRRDVVQVLSAMPIVTRPLARHNAEDDYAFKVMAAQALEIKFDANDQCGIVHSS